MESQKRDNDILNMENNETENLENPSPIPKRTVAQDSRMSLPFPLRLPLATGISFLSGMALGLSHGSQMAGLRFRAENAHRLPTAPTGWYLYHKSKNYNMALGGVKEGFKMGGKVAFWTGGFMAVEEMLDGYRGRKDVFSTVVASTTVAGGFSLWNRFPITTAARTAKTGIAFGLVYGLVQDAIGLIRGRRLGYVDFFLHRGKPRRAHEEDSTRVI